MKFVGRSKKVVQGEQVEGEAAKRRSAMCVCDIVLKVRMFGATVLCRMFEYLSITDDRVECWKMAC